MWPRICFFLISLSESWLTDGKEIMLMSIDSRSLIFCVQPTHPRLSTYGESLWEVLEHENIGYFLIVFIVLALF